MAKYRHPKLKSSHLKTKPEYGNARLLAAALDWVLGGVFSGIPMVIAWAALTGKSMPITNLYLFESSGFSMMTTIWVALTCLLFGFAYYVIFPWRVWPAQTLGKHLMHLHIERLDGKAVTFNILVVREFIFLVFIEGIASATSTYIKVLITTLSRFYVDSYLTIIWTVITVISMILVFGSKKHMALHDMAVKTIVVSNLK